jgi:predicted  nucleic acid-binding Zn-ribbon protein
MSFYDVHDAQINHMICTNCQTGAFAWMVQVFACPECGGSEFVFPENLDEADPSHSADKKDDGAEAASQTNVGKRKRPGNDEGRGGR